MLSKGISMGDLPARKAGDLRAKKHPILRMCDLPDANTQKRRKVVYKTNRKIWEVLKDGAWKGQRCFIVAGGESVNDFDLKALEGEHTIGINLAFRKFNPEIIYGMDARLWGWIENNEIGPNDKALFDSCKAIKIWSDISGAPLPEDIVTAPGIGRPGLSHKLSEGLGTMTNSGFGAINLALLLGASEIYLIGYDFYGDRWHAGYPQHGEAGNDFHRQCYEETSAEYREFPSKIINLNPKSKLKIFEFGTMPNDIKSAPAKIVRARNPGEPIFVNYYTADNGYKTFAENMKASLERLDLDYDVQPIKNRGNWDANTKVKPDFILKMLDAHPGRPVIWIDADAVVVSLPVLLLNCKADFACRIRETGELISSVMFFANNDNARALLKKTQELINSGDKHPFGEQIFFQKALKEFQGTSENLPETYCTIMGISPLTEQPVIEQHQASRKLKT